MLLEPSEIAAASSGGEACSHYSGTTRVTAPLAHVQLSGPAQSSCLMDDEVGQAASWTDVAGLQRDGVRDKSEKGCPRARAHGHVSDANTALQ